MTTPFLSTPTFAPVFNGASVPNGLLYTYQAGTTNPKPTFSDPAGIVPNTNPVQLDITGAATVRLEPGSYHFVLTDPTGTAVLWDQDFYNAPYLTAADLGALLYPVSSTETLVGVTPATLAYPMGDPRRYGAALDGVTDDTAALIAWASVGGNLTWPLPQTALITAAIPLVSNTTIKGVKGAVVQTATHDISLFTAIGKSGIQIEGLHFKQTSVGAAAYVGGVYLDGCSDCHVRNCEFEGMQWSGVTLSASTNCSVSYTYHHDALGGQIPDSGDIKIQSTAAAGANYNNVSNNWCYGGLEYGVAIEDPYSTVLPVKNIVQGNRIKGCTGYGVMVYMPDAGNSFNQIQGNFIEGVTGSIASNTSSGAGIYVVGAGAGGTQVIGNNVRNCCISTVVNNLAPAGVGISGTSAGTAPVVVHGNSIEGMTQYYGIFLTGVLGGASVSGNAITIPASNTTGNGIEVANSNNVTVSSNTITNLNTTSAQVGIVLRANGAGCSNVTVANNTVVGGHSSQIRTIQSGSNQVQDLTLTGNILTGGDASCTPLVFDSASAVNVLVANNQVRATTQPAVTQTSIQSVRYNNNYFNTTGTTTLNFTGTNTGSYYALSNYGSTDASTNNAGTGLIIEQFGTGAPAAGVHAVGDLRRNTSPSAAGVLFWVTTTAGAGTWKTVSNT